MVEKFDAKRIIWEIYLPSRVIQRQEGSSVQLLKRSCQRQCCIGPAHAALLHNVHMSGPMLHITAVLRVTFLSIANQ